jgi:hypothetical protein
VKSDDQKTSWHRVTQTGLDILNWQKQSDKIFAYPGDPRVKYANYFVIIVAHAKNARITTQSIHIDRWLYNA